MHKGWYDWDIRFYRSTQKTQKVNAQLLEFLLLDSSLSFPSRGVDCLDFPDIQFRMHFQARLEIVDTNAISRQFSEFHASKGKK